MLSPLHLQQVKQYLLQSVTFKSGGAAITDTSVTYTNTSGNTWTAAYTANASDTFGAVTFSIAYSDTVGNAGTAVPAQQIQPV